jgi:hypothetical protein
MNPPPRSKTRPIIDATRRSVKRIRPPLPALRDAPMSPKSPRKIDYDEARAPRVGTGSGAAHR